MTYLLNHYLKLLRREAGLTQVEVAARARVSQSVVSRIERGEIIGSPGAVRVRKVLLSTAPTEFGYR